MYPLTTNTDQFQELNDLATTAMLLNNIKQEQLNLSTPQSLLDFTSPNFQNLLSNQFMSSYNFSSPIKEEMSAVNFKQIEQSIREKSQYAQPLPIPDGM